MSARRKREKHGMTHKPIYRLWVSMISRCKYPSSPNYPRYGGRGITVCHRWQSFANFYADMGDKPEGMSLDRIDNDGPYSPENCEWRTLKDQHANRHNNRLITLNGQTKTCAQWARELGLSSRTIAGRLRRGASPEAALQPVSSSQRPAIRIAPPKDSA